MTDEGQQSVGEIDAEVWEWAEQWARRLPRWSDAKWARMNAALGYRVVLRTPELADSVGEPPGEGEGTAAAA